jgi:hypothetical protein
MQRGVKHGMHHHQLFPFIDREVHHVGELSQRQTPHLILPILEKGPRPQMFKGLLDLGMISLAKPRLLPVVPPDGLLNVGSCAGENL